MFRDQLTVCAMYANVQMRILSPEAFCLLHNFVHSMLGGKDLCNKLQWWKQVLSCIAIAIYWVLLSAMRVQESKTLCCDIQSHEDDMRDCEDLNYGNPVT